MFVFFNEPAMSQRHLCAPTEHKHLLPTYLLYIVPYHTCIHNHTISSINCFLNIEKVCRHIYKVTSSILHFLLAFAHLSLMASINVVLWTLCFDCTNPTKYYERYICFLVHTGV